MRLDTFPRLQVTVLLLALACWPPLTRPTSRARRSPRRPPPRRRRRRASTPTTGAPCGALPRGPRGLPVWHPPYGPGGMDRGRAHRAPGAAGVGNPRAGAGPHGPGDSPGGAGTLACRRDPATPRRAVGAPAGPSRRACVPWDRLQGLAPLQIAVRLMFLDARWEGLHPEYASDLVLAGLAKAMQKPIVSLETVAAQRAALLRHRARGATDGD